MQFYVKYVLYSFIIFCQFHIKRQRAFCLNWIRALYKFRYNNKNNDNNNNSIVLRKNFCLVNMLHYCA